MKKLSFISLCIAGVASLLQSCYVLKPDSGSVSSADYNQRISITDPHYNRVLSPAGYGAMAASIAAGAYAGMQAKIVQTQKGAVRTDNKPLNAIVGGMIGFGLNMLGNKIFQKERKVPVVDFEKWVKVSNNSYTAISNSDSRYLTIQKSSENKFIVKNYKDAKDFLYAFPNSSYTGLVVNKAIEILSRNELVQIENITAGELNKTIVRKAIFEKSANTKDVLTASKMYVVAGLNIEALAARKVYEWSDVTAFSQEYPNSAFRQMVFLNSLKNINRSDYANIIQYFPTFSTIPISELSNLLPKQKSNFCLLFFTGLTGRDTPEKYLQIAEKTANIIYPYKKYDIVSEYWNNQLININLIGNQIIENTRELANLLRMSSQDFNAFIKFKLEDEIKKSVYVTSGKLSKVSGDEDWKHWQKNFVSDKIFQYKPNVDNVGGVYTATLINNSRFDLPVKVDIMADFMLSVKFGGILGTVGNTLSVLTEGHSLNDVTNNIVSLGKANEKYYEIVKANSQVEIVMPVHSSMPFNSAGVSLMGLYSGKYEIEAKNLTDSVSIADQDINTKLLNKQAQWAYDVVNGKYDKKLRGVFSGNEYDTEAENKKMEDLLNDIKNKETATNQNCVFEQLEWDQNNRRSKYKNSTYGTIKVTWKYYSHLNRYSIYINEFHSGDYDLDDNVVTDGGDILYETLGKAPSLENAVVLVLNNTYCK